MSETDSLHLNGQCLCGTVSLQATVAKNSVGACHCSMCRRWGGGPLLAIDCGADLQLQGEQAISLYKSSDWAQRGFCSRCGTHLFYKLTQNNQHIVPAGLFDQTDGLHFDHQIFIDEKPEYYDFANHTHNMTGEEVFAQFAQPENT